MSSRDGNADEVIDDDGDGYVDADGDDVCVNADGDAEADVIGSAHVGDDADDAAGKAADAPGPDGIRSEGEGCPRS